MVEIKTLSGKLDMDSSQYKLLPNDYVDALNISHDAVEGSNDEDITPIIANRLGDATYTLPTGTNKVIGSFANTLRNTIIDFRWNFNGYHRISQFDAITRLYSTVLENLTDTGGVDILGFLEDDKILSVNVYNRDEGDLLFFLDSSGRPTEIDLTSIRTYIPVTRDIIDKGRKQPLSPPSVVYGNDTATRINNFRNKLFRFKYRWIYYNLEKSSFSPISVVPLPASIISDTYTNVITNNNVVYLVANTGDKQVKAIEIGVSFVEKTNDWSDFQSVTVIDKVKLGLSDNVDFPFSFYNDSTYPAIDIEESIELYDYVPEVANAQEMPNGNVLAYVGITEGYNKDLIPNVQVTVGTYVIASPPSGSLISTQVQVYGAFDYFYVVAFSGIPVVGTTINIKAQRVSDSVIVTGGTYVTVAGDTPTSIAAALQASVNTMGIFGPPFLIGPPLIFQIHSSVYNRPGIVEIIPPSAPLSASSVPVWKWSTGRTMSIVYFDKKGKTNGVVYDTKVSFPAYQDNVSDGIFLPLIDVSIYHLPPIWAYSFQFLFTKENTQSIFWSTTSVNITETDYIYLEVTGFDANAKQFPTTATVLSYTFQDGDRVRLIKPISLHTYFSDQYDSVILGLLNEPTISGVPQVGKKFLKIKKVAPFSDATFTPNNNFYEIEIYRPQQQSASGVNQTFFEAGLQFPILNPTTDSRVHGGQIQNQVYGISPATFEFKNGDWYFRQRTIALSDSGTATFSVVDRNFVDTYISAVNSIDGRPNIIDINARRAYYPTLIRFGQAYEANTNINGLNRFYAKNFDQYPENFGDVWRLKCMDKFMRVFQRDKIGMVPLFSSLGKDANGLNVVFQTDKLLNPIQYYQENVGIGTAKESLATSKYANYGCDNIRGLIWRVSLDGIIMLSIKYKVNSWSNDNLVLRTGKYKIYGVFDQRLNNYIISLEPILCIGVSAPDFTFDTAVVDTLYSKTVILIGSLDFTINQLVPTILPSWMSVSLLGYNLTFTGTPQTSDIGTGVPIVLQVTNDCGVLDISKTISVDAQPCVVPSFASTPVLPDGYLSTPYSFTAILVGTAPFILSSIVKPSWMTIVVSGNDINFTGTPDVNTNDIPVSFTVSNCSMTDLDFADTIDVSPDNWFISYTNNDSAVNLSVAIGNNNQSPSTTLYSGLYTTDPLSGLDVVDMPPNNMNVVLSVPGKTILSASCNGVMGVPSGSFITWSGITGGPLVVSFITN